MRRQFGGSSEVDRPDRRNKSTDCPGWERNKSVEGAGLRAVTREAAGKKRGTETGEGAVRRRVGARGSAIGREAMVRTQVQFRSGTGGEHEDVERAAP